MNFPRNPAYKDYIKAIVEPVAGEDVFDGIWRRFD